ncbi:hypothetical protein HRI_002315600 [Hibiscus trionum]|uniref:Retrotransposon gag domain-containing protein n=1 Tax=Hibiscus trionum TaxID=183268 RepID=A0A9W7M3H8_HIBTR|nr:hypothetical protein HRI_002315600 [Hibiscus trionum]
MVNNMDSIRSLQETMICHKQTLTSIQTQLSKHEQWNANTQSTLQEMSLLLQNMSAQMGISVSPSAGGDLTTDNSVPRSKAKLRPTTDDNFPFSPKPIQIELPIFIGKDHEEWIASAQEFFELYGTDDHHRVSMESFQMTSTAKKWFRWMQHQRQLASWTHLVEAIRKRFTIMEIESPAGQLSKLLQTSTVAEYQSRFEELAL